jgi:hypothetical protein
MRSSQKPGLPSSSVAQPKIACAFLQMKVSVSVAGSADQARTWSIPSTSLW